MPPTPIASEISRSAESRRGGLALLAPEHEAVGLREQPVAGEDRDVLAERDMARRPAAPQVVVVHRGQVVVDERVGVDELDRRRGR